MMESTHRIQGERIGETTFIYVVFDVESDPPMPLGLYERTDEDVVIYEGRNGYGQAPYDCVSVVMVGIKL